MQHQNNALLSWPHEVPAPVAHALVDAHFVRALELGPPAWWQQWQRERLQALLDWLHDKEWWRKWADSSVGPVSPIEALSKLPVMRREDYRALFESHDPVVPAEHGALTSSSTSGSSGVPVTFWRSELALRVNSNHYWADHQRQGRDLRQRMLVLAGSAGEHAGPHRTFNGDSWLQPGVQLARMVTNFTLEEHALWLCNQPASYLATTPTTLSGVIASMEMLNVKPQRYQQVLTYGSTVDPVLRESVRHTFGASLRDRFSCEEVGPIAFQCPESDDYYHTAVTNAIVEVVNESGKHVPSGGQGSVLVTGLHQWASPAVRYELGDIATWHHHCPGCGLTVPTLSALLGRKHFLIKSPAGKWRHIRLIARDWLPCAPFREYRLVQTNPLAFRAEFVLDQPITEAQSQATVAMLQRLVGPEYTFELAQLDAIPWPPGRKRQEFVGLMP
jgi:phenylacetate-CoA ligase